ncbi:MAG: hypothetical protein U5L76_01095 [Patescibacteria group bacterium]|nr:hypothetical protein [Patescibacteria group bacterium]
MIKFLHIINIVLFLVSIIIPPLDIACPARKAVNITMFCLLAVVLLVDLFFIFYFNKKEKTTHKNLRYLFIFYFCLILVFGSIFFLWSLSLVC